MLVGSGRICVLNVTSIVSTACTPGWATPPLEVLCSPTGNRSFYIKWPRAHMISWQIHWQNRLSVCIFISRSKVKILVSMFCIPHPGVYFSGLCICLIVAMVQFGVRLWATLMLEIPPAETPTKTTALLQTTTVITDHVPLHTHMMTWYGSRIYLTFQFQKKIDIYEFICVCPLGYYGTVYSTWAIQRQCSDKTQDISLLWMTKGLLK